jgi:hypothetical protein
MGPQHRVAATAAWPATATHPVSAGGRSRPASDRRVTGHGMLSPDVDSGACFADVIPAVIGDHPLRPTRWRCGGRPATHTYRWAVLAVAIAWVSHIAADAIFGRSRWCPGCA